MIFGRSIARLQQMKIFYQLTIGNRVVIPAGAVVTKAVADYQIVGGVPAKVIGNRK